MNRRLSMELCTPPSGSRGAPPQCASKVHHLKNPTLSTRTQHWREDPQQRLRDVVGHETVVQGSTPPQHEHLEDRTLHRSDLVPDGHTRLESAGRHRRFASAKHQPKHPKHHQTNQPKPTKKTPTTKTRTNLNTRTPEHLNTRTPEHLNA